MKVNFARKLLVLYTIAFALVAAGTAILGYTNAIEDNSFTADAGTGRFGRTCTRYSNNDDSLGCTNQKTSNTLYDKDGKIYAGHFIQGNDVFFTDSEGNNHKLGNIWESAEIGGTWCPQGYFANSCEIACQGTSDGTWSAWSTCKNGTQTRTNSCGASETKSCQICSPGTSVACEPTSQGYKTVKVCNSTGSGYSECEAVEYCGDSVVNGNEQCDDGNNNLGDGCDFVCQIEVETPTIETPEGIGFNFQAAGSANNDIPVDLACSTRKTQITWINDGSELVESDSVSYVWKESAGENIKYERRLLSPQGTESVIDSAILNSYSDFEDFVNGEGIYGNRVMAYSDTNGNNKYDGASEYASTYSKYCYVGFDISAPEFEEVKMLVNGIEDSTVKIGDTVVFQVKLNDALSGVDSLEGWIAQQGGSPRIFTNRAVFAFNETSGFWEYTFVMPSTYLDGTDVNLNENANYINFRAYDKAGNSSKIGNKFTFTVLEGDLIAPAAPTNLRFVESISTDVVECGEFTNEKTWYPTWDAVADTDLAYYEYISFNTDGNIGTRRELTTTQFIHTWESGEGTYGFKVRAVDTSGNVSEWVPTPNAEEYSSSCQIIVDLTAPVITIDSERTGLFSPTIIKVGGEITDNLSGVNEVKVFLTSTVDSNVVFEFIPTFDSVTGKFDVEINAETNSLPIGNYEISVYANDKVGNENLLVGSIVPIEKFGSISGRTFNDLGENGYLLSADGDYPNGMINGYSVRVYNEAWNLIEEQTTSTTGTIGQYKFENLPINLIYYVCGVNTNDKFAVLPEIGSSLKQVDGSMVPSQYAGALVVDNGSTATMLEESVNCWALELTEAQPSAGWVGIGYADMPVLPAPVQEGYRVNDGAPASDGLTQTCSYGGFTNINSASIYWNFDDTFTTGNASWDALIKFEREQSVDNTVWALDTTYDLEYTDYIKFAGDSDIEGKHYSRVRAYVDYNMNNVYDIGEFVSDWSNTCNIGFDKTAPEISNIESAIDNNGYGNIIISAEITDNLAGVMMASIDIFDSSDNIVFSGSMDGTNSPTYEFTKDSQDLSAGDYYAIITARDLVSPTQNESKSERINFTVIEDLAPVVEITSPVEGSVISANSITVNVTATDDVGMGSYYVRLWLNAPYLSNGGTLVDNCQSSPGGALLGDSRNDTCEFMINAVGDGTYFVTAQYLDSSNQWGQDIVEIEINQVAPAAPVMARIVDQVSGQTLLTCSNETSPSFGNSTIITSKNIRIEWNANSESDLAGYYFGTKANPKHQEMSATELFKNGTISSGNNPYYYSLIAFDTAGNESNAVYCGELILVDSVDTPEFLGWNPQNVAPIGTIPATLTCGSSFVGNTGQGISSVWSEVTNPFTEIKYIRYNERPNGAPSVLIWSNGNTQLNSTQAQDLNDSSKLASLLETLTQGSYVNNYTLYGTFGANEGDYTMRVIAFADINNDGSFQEGEPLSDWSNSCTITNVNAVITPQNTNLFNSAFIGIKRGANAI